MFSIEGVEFHYKVLQKYNTRTKCLDSCRKSTKYILRVSLYVDFG